MSDSLQPLVMMLPYVIFDEDTISDFYVELVDYDT